MLVPRDNCRYADIVVVGAGLAGAAAASLLGRRGFHVLLVDPRASCPPVFKAEKIEPDQAESIAELGLSDLLLSDGNRIREIRSYSNGTYLGSTKTTQYGLHYDTMVNALRQNLPATVEFELGRVCEIDNSEDVQVIHTDDGEKICCRLAVLACGLNGDLLTGLGLKRIWVQKPQSVAVAFNLARPDGRGFDFDSLTYSIASPRIGIDYISFFPLDQKLRANLFAFSDPTATWLQRFAREPNGVLRLLVPKLQRALGDYEIIGSIETASINLYRTEGIQPHGVVLVGDAAQNVCPSTAMGLRKIFTDLEILCSDSVLHWFSTPGMGREKLRTFSDNPRKLEADRKALLDAYYRRNACTAQSTRWRIHRARLRVEMEIGRVQRRLSGNAAQASAA